MNEWYKEAYVNRRDWLIFHFPFLPINLQEFDLLLVLDLAIEKKMGTSHSDLANYMGLSELDVDRIISGLARKDLLKIEINKEKVTYNIDAIFNVELKKMDKTAVTGNVFDLIEDVFARPLSEAEMNKCVNLSQKYTKEEIFQALRICDAHRKYSLNYLEAVLRNA